MIVFDVDAAIVDLDGTLVDTLDDFVAALALTCAEIELLPPPRDKVAMWIGKGASHLLACMLEDAGAPAAWAGRVAAIYQRRYREINGRHARVFPGVAQGLAQLRAASVCLACVTNKPTEFAVSLLRRKDLADHFAVVYGGDAFERRKPDPQPIVEACRTLGTRPPRTLVIGDSGNDLAAGRGAGCPVVLLRHGYNHGEPVEGAGADAVLDRLDMLGALLKSR